MVAMRTTTPTQRRTGPAIFKGFPPTGAYPGHTLMMVITRPMKTKPMASTRIMIAAGWKRGRLTGFSGLEVEALRGGLMEPLY